jgi:hypothetical protein
MRSSSVFFEKGELMSLKVTIHSTGSGNDLLTGKEGKEGLTVTFDDGTVRESFLSWASFRQLLALKGNQSKLEAKPALPVAPLAPGANGPVPVAK